MQTLLSFFAKLDFVGVQLKPTLNGSNRIKSVFGGFLSLIVSACIIFGFSYFGLSIIKKDKPIMNNIQRKSDTADTPFKKNPFMLVGFDSNSLPIHQLAEFKRAIQIELLYEVLRPPAEGEQSFSYTRYTGQVKQCDKTDFDPVTWDQVIALGYTPGVGLCLDPSTLKDPLGAKYEGEMIIRNARGDINSNFLTFSVKYCDEIEDPGCRDYLNKVGRITMAMYYMNYFLDQSDFSNPVKPDVRVSAYQLSQTVSQSIDIITQINEIVTDSSLFLSETSTEEFYSYSSSANSVSEFEPTKRIALEFIMSNNKIISVNERRYLKVPEMLANMGGFLKAAMLIANLLCRAYSEYVCYIKLGQIEFKHLNGNTRNNNFIENNSSNSQTPAVKSTISNIPIKNSISFKKASKREDLSFLKFLSSLFLFNKSLKNSREDRFKYLELNYLISCLTFIESMQRNVKKA